MSLDSDVKLEDIQCHPLQLANNSFYKSAMILCREILSSLATRGGQRSCSEKRAPLRLPGIQYLAQECFSRVKSQGLESGFLQM